MDGTITFTHEKTGKPSNMDGFDGMDEVHGNCYAYPIYNCGMIPNELIQSGLVCSTAGGHAREASGTPASEARESFAKWGGYATNELGCATDGPRYGLGGIACNVTAGRTKSDCWETWSCA